MLKVPVYQVKEGSDVSIPLTQEIENIFEDISKRAFGLFQERGSGPGHDLDDWFQAERETLWTPPAELIETESQFKLRLAAPGYDPKDFEITAYPGTIVVLAEAEKEARKSSGRIHLDELSCRKLFRRIGLPSIIDVEKVSATLDQGVLRLVAAKLAPVTEKVQPATMNASV
jgi:HSP20 family protein